MVKFYKTSSDKRCINKSLSSVASVDNVIKHSLDIASPYVILDIKYDCNYAEIDGVFYYVMNISSDTGHRFTYSLRKDVLMTYRNAILNSYAICNRRSTNKDSQSRYLTDSMAHVMQNKQTINVTEFDEGFDTVGNIILTTVGG